MKSFEKYLEEYFITNCFTGVKDGVEGAMEYWFENLDVQEVIDLAEEWGTSLLLGDKVEEINPIVGGVDFSESLDALNNLKIR